jgi:methionyl-tRNA formyltransferase
MLSKEDGQLDWGQPAEDLVNRIRGVTPWPGATTMLNDELFKVWKASLGPKDVSGSQGEVMAVGEDGITVACGQGSVCLLEVQLAGKKRMKAESFMRGYSVSTGTILGSQG